jgi:SagB-type dehydrogenase family enzyme
MERQMNEQVGHDFMEKTKYKNMGESPQRQGVEQPPLQLDFVRSAKWIELPKPAETDFPTFDLRKAIEQRRSVRQYSEQPLSLEELSLLLWLTQGVKETPDRPVTFRTVPSAGARHAYETYILANRVSSLEPGIYRFMAIEHALIEEDLTHGIAERLEEACWKQKMVTKSAATFIWAAVVERMTWRYIERGFRYLHLDAGHICQNLYLAGEAIGCGTCAIGAYDDDDVNELLGFDGMRMMVTYLATLGKKKV